MTTIEETREEANMPSKLARRYTIASAVGLTGKFSSKAAARAEMRRIKASGAAPAAMRVLEVCPQGYTLIAHMESRGPRHHSPKDCECGHRFA